MFPSPNFDTPFDSLLKIMSSSSSSSSPQNPNPPLLFNFPSPFLDEHESPLNQIFFQNHHHDQTLPPQIAPRPNPGKSKAEETDRNPTAAAVAPPRRRRAGKKDRHSKICTAQGIRDRRMRLSLQVARKFFDLQDMLGYDKASKTIEWLFTQSKSAIKELVDDLRSPPPNEVKSESFVSECDEDVSGIEEINSNIVTAQNPGEMAKPYSSKRESREKARARARCRTREKMMVKRLRFSEDQPFKPNPNLENNSNDHQIIRFDEGEEIRVSSLEQQLSDVGMIEKFLGSTTTSSAASDYQCAASASDYSEFLGNWDVLSSERINCFQLSFAGNLNPVYSATTPEFPRIINLRHVFFLLGRL